MIFEKFNITHKDILIKWAKDKVIHQFLGGIFPLDNYMNYLLTAENKLTYIVIHDSKKIGMVDVELYPKEKNAAISILITPEARGNNFGKIVLEKTVQLSEFKNYKQVDAFIEPENIASIRCFERAGFKKIKEELDEDGMYQFSYFFVKK